MPIEMSDTYRQILETTTAPNYRDGTATVPVGSVAFVDKKETKIGNLFLDCQTALMPISYPPSGHIWELGLFEVNVKSGVGGLSDHSSADPTGHIKWNNTGLPDWAERCELSNYYKRTLLNLRTQLEVKFTKPQPESTAQKEETYNWPIMISKLDPGSTSAFVFYIWNCCSQTLFLVGGPTVATGLFEGESLRTNVKIVRSETTVPIWTGGFMMIEMPLKKP